MSTFIWQHCFTSTSQNPFLGHVSCLKHQFSGFYLLWIQRKKPDRHPDKQSISLLGFKGASRPSFISFVNMGVLLINKTKTKNFADFQQKNSWIFKIFKKSNFDGGKFLIIWSSINLPWGHVMSPKKFGPDRFSRFDVYWIQTDTQTDRQTSQIYI